MMTLTSAESVQLRRRYIERLARNAAGWWNASAEERAEAQVERCIMQARGENVAKIPPDPALVAEFIQAVGDLDMTDPADQDEAEEIEAVIPKSTHAPHCGRCGETYETADHGLRAINCGCWRGHWRQV